MGPRFLTRRTSSGKGLGRGLLAYACTVLPPQPHPRPARGPASRCPRRGVLAGRVNGLKRLPSGATETQPPAPLRIASQAPCERSRGTWFGSEPSLRAQERPQLQLAVAPGNRGRGGARGLPPVFKGCRCPRHLSLAWTPSEAHQGNRNPPPPQLEPLRRWGCAGRLPLSVEPQHSPPTLFTQRQPHPTHLGETTQV